VSKIIVSNRRARFDYFIEDTFEAGIVLKGPEIKSVRNGEVSLEQSYIRPKNGELFLINAHIKPYKFTDDKSYDPVRPRKILLNRTEIDKLIRKLETQGKTIVPLSLYLKDGLAKLEIALAKGKTAPDKRSSIKERESKREIARSMKR
jgi:SsrA-binding protein